MTDGRISISGQVEPFGFKTAGTLLVAASSLGSYLLYVELRAAGGAFLAQSLFRSAFFSHLSLVACCGVSIGSLYNLHSEIMKFQSSIVAASLAVAGFRSAEAFSPSAALSTQRTLGISPVLPMVATNEVSVDGEVKGKKTREVSDSGGSRSAL